MKNPVRFLSQDKIWIIHTVKGFYGLNYSPFRDIINGTFNRRENGGNQYGGYLQEAFPYAD